MKIKQEKLGRSVSRRTLLWIGSYPACNVTMGCHLIPRPDPDTLTRAPRAACRSKTRPASSKTTARRNLEHLSFIFASRLRRILATTQQSLGQTQ